MVNHQTQQSSGRKISFFGYLLISVFFLFVGLAVLYLFSTMEFDTSEFGGLIKFIILLIISMSFAAFIFGTMQSYATYSGKQLAGNLKLGGPVVGAALVMVGAYYFMKNPEPITQTEEAPSFQVEFTMESSGPEPVILTDVPLSYKQRMPVPRNPYPLFPLREGLYIRDRVDLPPKGERYLAKVKREPIKSTRGIPANVPETILCFVMKENPQPDKQYVAAFKCKEGGDGIIEDVYDWMEPCGASSLGVQLEFIKSAYADTVPESQTGWIVPSLITLRQQNKEKGITYTAFKIYAEQMTGLENVTTYTYRIYVNGTPIYVDGWGTEDTETLFSPREDFEFEFGLENLDFSGAELGNEIIKVRFDFYSKGQKLTTIELERTYAALRDVSPETITKKRIQFKWTGEYVIGKKQDGFEVFIWSTTDPNEMMKRKKWFDQSSVSFDNQEAVSVIRPPLGKNPYYGLVIGLVDEVGRIKFTFNEETANRILAWVKNHLSKVRIRDEFGPHPIVKANTARVERLKGI
jgi:hypothetical protein